MIKIIIIEKTYVLWNIEHSFFVKINNNFLFLMKFYK